MSSSQYPGTHSSSCTGASWGVNVIFSPGVAKGLYSWEGLGEKVTALLPFTSSCIRNKAQSWLGSVLALPTAAEL